jgi:hypothetical protein
MNAKDEIGDTSLMRASQNAVYENLKFYVENDAKNLFYKIFI